METPIWKKTTLTIKEAAQLSGIGEKKIRELTEQKNCEFVIFIGTHRRIKRRKFEEYLESKYSI